MVDASARAAKNRARLVTTPDGVQESIVDSTVMEWIPLSEGEWFKPLGFGPGGWRRLLLRLSPGVVVPRHRHRGEVHVQPRRLPPDRGPRRSDRRAATYEPAGNVDSWAAVGDRDASSRSSSRAMGTSTTTIMS
jgi:hypothetical protein